MTRQRGVGDRRASLDDVLRLLDARLGSPVEVKPARPGLLRVCIHGPRAGAEPDVADLRVLLVADVLTRIAELHGLQALTVLAMAGLSSGQSATLDRDASALGIHPSSVRSTPEGAELALGGPANVHVAGGTIGPGGCRDGVLIDVGPATARTGTDGRAEPTAPRVYGEQERDPLAVRLALMRSPYRQPAELDLTALATAMDTLSDWRYRVAKWAESPSRPIPADLAATLSTAFEHDLDTASALAVLHNLEAEENVPPGAKFETFVYVDRVLALDLAREIGRVRS